MATRIVKFIRKGDKGDDAVDYDLIPSVNCVKADHNGTPIGEAITLTAYKIVGSERTGLALHVLQAGSAERYYCQYSIDNGDWTECVSFTARDANSGFHVIYGISSNIVANITSTVKFRLRHTSDNGVPLKTIAALKVVKDGTPGDKGDKGEQGAVLRGPQAWSDCATGYNFQAGGSGETWKDVVMYGNNYYSCIKSHAKTADNYPGSTADVNNKYWQLGDKIELVATKILLATYALVKNLGVECIDMKDANGNILFQAKDGNITCKTGNFDGITVNNAQIQSGQIAGFKISGNGLTNDPFTNDAYIIFRNDTHKCFAGIGGNVLPATSGSRAVARFENEDTQDWWGLGRNIAMLLHAKNGGYNHAFLGEGNGTLNGMIAGHRFSKFTCTTANTIYNGYAALKENNYWCIYSGVSGSGITLPKLSEVRQALSIGNSTPFCILFTVLADLNTNDFYVYGRNKLKDSSSNTPWNNSDLPLLTHWNNSYDDRLTMGAGDSITFLLIYDPTKTSGTLNGYGLTYTARRINQQS